MIKITGKEITSFEEFEAVRREILEKNEKLTDALHFFCKNRDNGNKVAAQKFMKIARDEYGGLTDAECLNEAHETLFRIGNAEKTIAAARKRLDEEEHIDSVRVQLKVSLAKARKERAALLEKLVPLGPALNEEYANWHNSTEQLCAGFLDWAETCPKSEEVRKFIRPKRDEREEINEQKSKKQKQITE